MFLLVYDVKNLMRGVEFLIYPLLPTMTQALLSCHCVQPGHWDLEVSIGNPANVDPIVMPP